MELTDLRYFTAVAEAGSFVEGARRVHVSPAAMSKAIKRLEVDLGVELFTRSTRRVDLTRAGDVVLRRARAMLEEQAELRRDLAARDGEIAGELRVAAMEVFSTELLPGALATLVRDHPRVRPSTLELIPEDIERLVGEGRCDVGFTIGGGARGREVEAHVLGASAGVLVCGEGHPLHRSGRVAPARVVDHPFVVPRFLGREGSAPLDQFPPGVERTIGATIELMQMGIELCARGAFLGYFPEVSVRGALADGRLRSVRGVATGAPFELKALTRRGRQPSRATEQLIAIVRAAVSASLARPLGAGRRARHAPPRTRRHSPSSSSVRAHGSQAGRTIKG
jgi:DNA-binding transcriptional LysR family regulator